MDGRLVAHSTRIDELERELDDNKRENKKLREQMQNVLQEVLAAKSMETEPRELDQGYDRDIDHTICRVRCTQVAPKDNVKKTIEELTAVAEIAADDWDLDGDGISQSFVVRFKGAVALQTRRVDKLLSTLRKSNGIMPSTWWSCMASTF